MGLEELQEDPCNISDEPAVPRTFSFGIGSGLGKAVRPPVGKDHHIEEAIDTWLEEAIE